MKDFIYVYDMPAKFTADVRQLSPEWHSEQYDYDQVCMVVLQFRTPIMSTESSTQHDM